MAAYLPAGPRSATAAAGISDIRDETLYSAVLLQNSGSGNISFFTVPKGQAIPALRGGSGASTNAWQTTFTDTTTNLEKAGELGDGIGDAGIRGISLHVEAAAIAADPEVGGVVTAYGATNLELSELHRKCALELRVSKKPMHKAPVFTFPSVGGTVGTIAAAGAAPLALDISTNGVPGAFRRLVRHIMASRRDTLEAVLSVAGGSSLEFRDDANDGIPTLVWCVLPSNVRGDVR